MELQHTIHTSIRIIQETFKGNCGSLAYTLSMGA